MSDLKDNVIQREHLKKLYYFALKKTNNRYEAEDLAQDIASQVLISLGKGSRPADLDRWIWGIAHNRYARWADEKRKRNNTVLDKAIIEGLPDHEATAEDQMLLKENLSLLRRELALLTSEFREIIIPYYFEGRRISEIAARLELPQGTIKRKLYESRRHIREGIEMTRESGSRSFKADEISFSKSGSDGQDGSPWGFIQRLIPKNILLSAYQNPQSLEELCLELGISMPYMEEEVRLLTDGTLLKEVKKGRFETDFIIVDREMQHEIFLYAENMAEDFSALILNLLREAQTGISEMLGERWEPNFIHWTLIPLVVDFLVQGVKVNNKVPVEYTKRPHEGYWDLVGYETYDFPFSIQHGLNGLGTEQEIMHFYKLGMEELWHRAGEMSVQEISVLAAVIRQRKVWGDCSLIEQEVLLELEGRGFIERRDDSILPHFPVLKGGLEPLLQYLSLSPVYTRLEESMNDFYKKVYSVVGGQIPDRLNRQLKFVSGEFLYHMRMMSLRYALEQGEINWPDHPEKSTLAMFMILK